MRVRCGAASTALFGARSDEISPVSGRAARAHARARRRRPHRRALARGVAVPDLRGRSHAPRAPGRRTGRWWSCSRISTGPTPPRSSCWNGLFGDTEDGALLLVLTSRPERDHPSWRAEGDGGARAAASHHRDRAGGALRRRRARAAARAGRRRHAAAGDGTADPRAGGGQPVLPGGARPIARRRGRAGARATAGWRFDHEVPVEVPPTVEKVILARIDRLEPDSARGADRRVGARPAVRPSAAGGRGRRPTAASDPLCTTCSGWTSSGRVGAGPSRSSASSTR